jgi:quercetin dioxygenase-like cupin family protein
MNEVKTIKIISAYMFFGILLMLSTNLHAQDILKVGTNLSNKVLLDNDQVRVILVESVPGVVTPWHSHPNYVLYALTNGKLEITEQDKKASVLEFKAGQALYFPAVTHTAKNIGTTTVKIILTELKPAKK